MAILAAAAPFVLLNDALLKLVTSKLAEPKDVYVKAVDKDDMIRKFQVAGIKFDPTNMQAGSAHPTLRK